MNISIVGTGYVGLVSGACFAEMGIDVTWRRYRREEDRASAVGRGSDLRTGARRSGSAQRRSGTPAFHHGSEQLSGSGGGRLLGRRYAADEDGSADLRYVLEVARTFGRNINKYTILVTKSTVPVGTSKKVKAVIQEELDKRGVQIPFEVASNPEFLKEGAAIKDFMSPDRIVVGTESERAQRLLSRLYRPFLVNNFRIYFMDIPSAEMTKYAANAMLATRISFMNDIANLCDEVGADIDMVRKGIGTDARIGNKFLYAGCGYGGSCFPKDVRALARTGTGVWFSDADHRGGRSRQRTAEGDRRTETCGRIGRSARQDRRPVGACLQARNRRYARSARPGGDRPLDTRRRCGEGLRSGGDGRMPPRVGDAVVYCSDMYEAVVDADALVLLTEWKQFRLPSWTVIRKVMANPLVIDGRNIYDKAELVAEGFTYKAIGK